MVSLPDNIFFFITIESLKFQQHLQLYQFSFDPIDIMSKAIQDLLALVKMLREEVAHQTNEINHLRQLIENCYACRDTAV